MVNKILLLSNEKTISNKSLNADNLCFGGIATASHSSNLANNAFDGNFTDSYSKWWYTPANSIPSWIQYQFIEETLINVVSIVSYYNSGYEAIKDFKIFASNSGLFNGEEVELFNGTHPNDTTKDFVEYKFNNYSSYKFYRIAISSLYHGNGSNNSSIAQIKMGVDLKILYQLPSHSEQNFINYGMDSPTQVDGTFTNKNYILSKEDSEIKDNVRSIQINRKPLSIKLS